MSNDVLVVIAIIKAKPEKADELHQILADLVAPTLTEEGCIRYEMNVSDDRLTYVFTEQWASRPLWDVHMETPGLLNLKARLDELTEDFELHTLSLDPVNPTS